MPELSRQPVGDSFPRPDELTGSLASAGLQVTAQVRAGELAAPSPWWQQRQQAVTDLIAARYAHHPAWQHAHEQQEQLGRLLAAGELDTVLVHAVRPCRAGAPSPRSAAPP